VAKWFDKFYMHNLSFEYVPTTGTMTEGEVAIVPNYDPSLKKDVSTKEDLLDAADVTRGAVWQKQKCKLDPKKIGGTKYVGTTKKVGAEARQEEVCRTNVVVTTAAADGDAPVGELWVEYDVTLSEPKGLGQIDAGVQYIGGTFRNANGGVGDFVWESSGQVFATMKYTENTSYAGVIFEFLAPGMYRLDWFEKYTGTLNDLARVDVWGADVVKRYGNKVAYDETSARINFEWIIEVLDDPVTGGDRNSPGRRTMTQYLSVDTETAYKAGIVVGIRSLTPMEMNNLKWIQEPPAETAEVPQKGDVVDNRNSKHVRDQRKKLV
jgi:hypothetical protein